MSHCIRCRLSLLHRGSWAGLLVAFVALLSACGGGGGEGGGGSDASYSISTGTITFSATQGAATPLPQIVTVTVNSGTVFIATSQSANGFIHGFQLTGPTTGEITITPDAPTSAGTFGGTISVRGCSTANCSGGDVSGSPKTISVTYTVSTLSNLSSTPAAIDFLTSTGVTPAAKTLDLSLSTGAAGWTSQIVYIDGTPGWLGITPGSGTLPQTVTVNADVTSIPAGTHTATITFNAANATKVVPVTLTVTDPAVNFASPYVATTGVGGDVIIRGYGFASVATGLQVNFGGNSATSVTFVSDTEIHASYPPLAAGNYQVNVGNGGAAIAPRAQLVVFDAPSFSTTTIVRAMDSGLVGNLIYDDERKAVYLMDPDNNRIEGYRFTAGAWVPDAPLVTGGGAGNPRIALSPDGTELLKTSGSTMSRINPATLSLIENVSALSFLGAGAVSLNLIAFANDGNAIGNSHAPVSGISLYRYDMLTHQFAALSTQPDMTNRTIVASGDGDTLVLPTFESLDPAFAKPVFTHDSSNGTLAQTAATTTSTEHVSVSRNGSRIILTTAERSAFQVTTVYDSSFSVLGVLPDSSHDLRGFVISPDGTKAYAYYTGTGLIRKFNLPAVGGVVEVGGGTAVTSSPGSNFNAMTISADGGTLFLAGDERLIIMPAP
jgi:hypothetical protein